MTLGIFLMANPDLASQPHGWQGLELRFLGVGVGVGGGEGWLA